MNQNDADLRYAEKLLKENNEGGETIHIGNPLNGRRLLRAQLSPGRLIEINRHDTSRISKVGTRAQRRARLNGVGPRRVGKNFRPIYGHGLVVNPPHVYVIKALGVKDRRIAARYLAERSKPESTDVL